MDEIDPKGEELIRIICSYLSKSLEDALEEVEEKELIDNNVDSLEIAQKFLKKTLSYIEEEGWLDDEEIPS